MRQSNHSVSTAIVKEKPSIVINARYKDDFTDDSYVIESVSCEGTKKITFEVNRNGKSLGYADLDNRNYELFMESVYKVTQDHDFAQTVRAKHSTPIISELKKFIEYFDDAIIANGLTLEGQVKRMKQIAGLLK